MYKWSESVQFPTHAIQPLTGIFLANGAEIIDY